ncbi:MAG: PHB depolymerase family esterase [Myxococcota bacterium]
MLHHTRIGPLLLSFVLMGALACSDSSSTDASSNQTADADIQDSGSTAESDAQAPDSNTALPDTGDSADTEPDPPDAQPDTTPFEPPDPDTLPEFPGGERPSPFFVPEQYEPDRAWPLVVQLHGFTVNAFLQDLMLRTSELVDEFGFILLTPEGTTDSNGDQFWNASDVCCDFDDSDVDDVTYLNALIDEAQLRWHIDPDRIYVLGHSNGGFMSYRLACDSGERFAGMMSLAGDMALDPESCVQHPLTVLHVHGTADDVIFYEGGLFQGGLSPGARASIETWANINGCDGTWVSKPPMDLDTSLAGAETRIEEQTGCSSGASVALWTIDGGVHVPAVSDGLFMREVMTILLAQTRIPPQGR